MPVISQRLKQLRREKNITQTELAMAVGVKRSCISNWESGTRKPPSVKVSQLCRYFGVSADYLCGRVESRNAVIAPPSFKIDITRLNNEGQSQLLNYYNFLLTNEKFTN